MNNVEPKDYIRPEAPPIPPMQRNRDALTSALAQLEYCQAAKVEWERKAISNFESCAEMEKRIYELSRLLAHNIERAEGAESKLALVREQRDNELRTNHELEQYLVRFPDEKAASAMFDIFYQTEGVNTGNVQLGRSDARALGEWISKALNLR